MRKHTALKWTKELAASEFNINPRTLTNRLKGLDINPDKNGLFTTQQICSAVFGDIDSERLGLVRAQRIKQELDNQVMTGELVNAIEMSHEISKSLSAMRQRILSNSKLDEEEKDKLLRELGQCLDLQGFVCSDSSRTV